MFEWAFISFFRWIVSGLANFGYWICLLAAITGHFMYVGGFKKGAKVSSLSIVSYALLASMSGALN